MLKSKAKWNFNELDSNGTIASVMECLFHERGIYSIEEQKQFMYPKLEDVQHPKYLDDVKKAKERVLEAIDRQEKIIVYGDYDADGVTSTALLVTVLRELGANCDYYIPNRFLEGYGLHKEALEKFHTDEVSLIITVDNGIANDVEADFAKYLGLDLIITDHHEVQTEIPNAYAIIHPSLSQDYSFNKLAGVGVAFQFAHYLRDEMPTHLLDLVAIGTIADLVPLVSENRTFVYHGLKELTDTENIGLTALMQNCHLDKEVTARDVGFTIAPRLNAVGRLQNASLAVELLLTEDMEHANQIAKQIDELNVERQQIVNKIVKEAEKQVNPEDGFIILYNESWHEGVLGIAASRLVRKFDRPVMMLTYKSETDELKGSARSIPAFNIFENAMKFRHLFTNFGGHSQAAGMTFPYENLEVIKSEFNHQVFTQLTDEDFKQVIHISSPITMDLMTEELVQRITSFAPFGMGNEEPNFYFKGKPTQLRQIGQDNKHLKLQFAGQTRIEAIGFGIGRLYYSISPNSEIEIVGKLQLNEWNGNRTVQILIEDLAVNDWQLLDYRGRKSDSTISPYLHTFSTNTLVANNLKRIQHFASDQHDIQLISYDKDLNTVNLAESEILYVLDLPDDIQTLKTIVEKTNPAFIHVSYSITDDAYLQSIPTREDFKWMYGYLFKHAPIHLKIDLPTMMQLKRWTKDKTVFILKVFLDLKFIHIEDNVIYINKDVEKTDLSTSKTYQQRLEKGKIEKELYYSTYEELKQWFEQHLQIGVPMKEEIPDEL